jgi:hypothetical protein
MVFLSLIVKDINFSLALLFNQSIIGLTHSDLQSIDVREFEASALNWGFAPNPS